MPRRLRAEAPERARDRRYIRPVDRRRFLRSLVRKLQVLAGYKTERVLHRYSELRDLINDLKREYERAVVEGRRHPLVTAILRVLATMVYPESARKDRVRALYAANYTTLLAEASPLPWDLKDFVDPAYHEELLALIRNEAIAKDWEMRGVLRRERTPEMNRTVLTNDSRRGISALNQTNELINDPWMQMLYATLWSHPYCHASHGLAFFDFTQGARVYNVVTHHKENNGVPATFGAFAETLALQSAEDDKPENETIPLTLDTQVDFFDLNQSAVVATNDTGTVQISYPLYFVMERPSRVEALRARQLGRREERDNMRHCSLYRLMRGARRAKWKVIRYKGRIIRITIRLPRTVVVEA